MKHGYLSTPKVLGFEPNNLVSTVTCKMVEKVIGISQLNRLMEEIGPPWPEPEAIIDHLFNRLNIEWRVEDEGQLAALDGKPKVFVANHPYGLPDAFAMFRMLASQRPRVKLFANTLLSATKLDDDRLLYVDPFRTDKNRSLNRHSVAQAMKHLRAGGDLALFPGRICSHLKTSDWTVSDSEWTDQVHRFVEISGGHMVPMHISGQNSWVFNLSGLLHPRLRTALLLREFLRGGHDFRFRIGEPLTAEQIATAAKAVSPGVFARTMTYTLKQDLQPLNLARNESGAVASPSNGAEVLEFPVPSGKKYRDLVQAGRHLITQNAFSVYAHNHPLDTDLEDAICQVRLAAYASETNAREPSALRDRFDDHYSHLVLWDNSKDRMVGTYRYFVPGHAGGDVRADDLVTNSIFDLSAKFMSLMPQSMELGRAAIAPEYQKSFVPLILLWRAIMEIPAEDKNIKYLFGPVTMGGSYKPISRELLKGFLERDCMEQSMEGFISPKRPLKLDLPREISVSSLLQGCRNFTDLGNLIAGFEGGKRTLPVLFRHYTNVGCRYLSVGEWRELNNSVTGLTMLPLKNVRLNMLERYFGVERAQEFLAGR